MTTWESPRPNERRKDLISSLLARMPELAEADPAEQAYVLRNLVTAELSGIVRGRPREMAQLIRLRHEWAAVVAPIREGRAPVAVQFPLKLRTPVLRDPPPVHPPCLLPESIRAKYRAAMARRDRDPVSGRLLRVEKGTPA